MNAHLVFARALLAFGCLVPGACTTTAQPRADADTQREILNEGYSILYRDARTISAVKYLLWIKVESDAFDKIIREAAAFGSDLRKDMSGLAKKYPALKLDVEALPELEKRKRFATGFDKLKDIAPVTGKKGRDFERVVLNSLANGLNQERHLAEEIAKEEPDPGLKKFMQQTTSRMDKLYERANTLLEQKYFK